MPVEISAIFLRWALLLFPISYLTAIAIAITIATIAIADAIDQASEQTSELRRVDPPHDYLLSC